MVLKRMRGMGFRKGVKPSTKFMKENKVDIAQDKRLTKIERAIKRNKPEIKYVDVSTGSSTYYAYYKLDATGAERGLVGLTGYQIPAGTSSNQRIGEEIKISSVDIRMEYTVGATANNKCRVIVFQADTSLTYSAGVPSQNTYELYKILTNCESAPYSLTSPYSKDLNFRFKVLYDKSFRLNGYDQSNGIKHIRINKGFKKCSWGSINGSGGPVVLPTDGQLYMLVIDNDTTETSSNHMAYALNARVNFSDN